FPTETHDGILLRFDLLVAVFEVDPNSGIDQEYPKYIQDPFEAVDQVGAHKDEHAPEYDCSDDAPEQYLMIIFLVDLEGFQDQKDDKNIVDRQCLFSKVSREVHRSRGGTALVVDVDQPSETGRDDLPENGRLQGGSPRHFVCRTAIQAQVQNQEQYYGYRKDSKKFRLTFAVKKSAQAYVENGL